MGPCSNLSCEIQNDWTRNNVMVYGLAGAMPEDKYGFKPVPEEQSFGERVLHVAQVNVSLLQGLGAKTPPPVIDPKATSKAEAMAAVTKVGEYGIAVIKEFSDQQLTARVESPWFMGPMSTRQRILYFLMTHSQDTYGQLVVYRQIERDYATGEPPAVVFMQQYGAGFRSCENCRPVPSPLRDRRGSETLRVCGKIAKRFAVYSKRSGQLGATKTEHVSIVIGDLEGSQAVVCVGEFPMHRQQ